MIRKATIADLDQVEQCFVERLTHEQAHTAYTSWKLGVYPTRATAEQALSDGQLYVMEQDGDLCAGMIASPNQPDKFLSIPWKYPAQPEEVFVLHLLCVRPTWARRGVGQALVQRRFDSRVILQQAYVAEGHVLPQGEGVAAVILKHHAVGLAQRLGGQVVDIHAV